MDHFLEDNYDKFEKKNEKNNDFFFPIYFEFFRGKVKYYIKKVLLTNIIYFDDYNFLLENQDEDKDDPNYLHINEIIDIHKNMIFSEFKSKKLDNFIELKNLIDYENFKTEFINEDFLNYITVKIQEEDVY